MGISLGVRSDSYPGFEGVINPRLGLVFEPIRDNYLKVLYGQAFRAPSPYEKYYYNVNTSKANLNLEPELIDTYEISFERSLPSLYLGLSIYRNLISNLITQVLDPGDNLLQYQNNTGKIESVGTEFSLKRTFGYTRSYAYFGCAIQRSVDLYTSQELTDSPGVSANAGFVYSFLPGTSLATELIYLGKRRTLAENYTDPYLLTNLTLMTENLLGLMITMKANNLFDAQYADPASVEHVMDTIPQDGRTYLVSVGHRF
jgi:iron complex outermembrane receptor protein